MRRIAGIAGLVWAMAAPVLAQETPLPQYYGYGHMWGNGYGAGFVGFGMMFLFWGAIIVLAVLAARWLMQRDDRGTGKSSALDTLKDRLARGEIDIEDYEARRKALDI